MFEELKHILELTDDKEKRFMPPKDLYNELNLLRLTLFWFSKQASFIINSDLERLIVKALKFQESARCYTNATIETPFKKRYKDTKDPLAEPNSNVSGVIGHFSIKYGKKREKIVLKPDATQFVLLQANFYNELQKGFKSATNFHQVARTIACMIYNINTFENKKFDQIGYYVLAPASQLKLESFKNYTYKKEILTKIKNRIEQYGDELTKSNWFNHLELIFQRIDVELISWEDLIKFITKNDQDYGNKMDLFYKKCLKYNGKE